MPEPPGVGSRPAGPGPGRGLGPEPDRGRRPLACGNKDGG